MTALRAPTRPSRPWRGALVAAGLLACALARAAGTAVPIGGGLEDDNHAVWNRLVAAAGGPGARFVVFGTASGEPVESAKAAAENLRRHGAVPDILPVSPLLPGTDVAKAVADPALVARVQAARGVFFTGGSQDRIVDSLQPGGRRSPLLEAVWALYERGGVVAGTSAGAAIMSDPMFRDAPDLVAVLQGRLRPGAEIDRGLGFVGPGVFVDQHFFTRGRIGRMLPMMVSAGVALGVGVEENSAAFFHDGEIEVLGVGGALVVDLREARADAATLAQGLRIEGVRVNLLSPGDRYLRASHRVVPLDARAHGTLVDPADKGYQPEHEHADFVIDLLAPQAFPQAMVALMDNRESELRGLAFHPVPAADEPRPGQGFELRLVKDARSRGWMAEIGGNDTWTVTDLRLDVQPVKIAQPFYAPWPAPASR